MSYQKPLIARLSNAMLRICIILKLISIINAQLEGHIVGGLYTAVNKYPHSAFMVVDCVVENGLRTTFVCSASIFSQQMLLTAGHCLYECGIETRITINMGDEHREKGVKRRASSFIYHEKYNPYTNGNDIAIVKMFRPVAFNSQISRVAIMKKPPYNESAHLAGWGMVNEVDFTYDSRLKEVDQQVWKREACIQMLDFIPFGTICASSKVPNFFPSRGDSGSALVVRDYIQIGLVSFKLPTLADNVIIYTDVGYFYDWIANNAKRLYCDSRTNLR